MDIIQITPNKLDIIIFDVEHGNCAFVQSPRGETLLLDCGNKENFSPAKFIRNKGWANEMGIETLVISHHDSDHIADYEEVVSYLNPKVYYNNEIPLATIKAEKDYKEGDNKHKYIKHRESLNPCNIHEYSGFKVDYFHNNFKTPRDEKLDVNYHSIITFIKHGNMTVCFPGDITNEGLMDLTDNNKNKSFLNKMIETNIFITPHHGRMCKEEESKNELLTNLLKKMNPDIIISSDKNIDKTNENSVATNYYDQFSKGITFDAGSDVETVRKILTTRNDNAISISISENNFYINTNAFKMDIDSFIENSKKIY